MRYDTLVTLVFDENSGKVGAEQTPSKKTKIFSNLSELGVEKSQLVIGNLKDETKVLRTITRYENPVTYIIVNGSKYNVEKRVNYDKTSTFYIVKQKGSGHG
nr:MAG TPA: head closure knob [Caudoviricetes sp.]